MFHVESTLFQVFWMTLRGKVGMARWTVSSLECLQWKWRRNSLVGKMFPVTLGGRNWDKWCDEVTWNYHITWQFELVRLSAFQATRFFCTLRESCDQDWVIRFQTCQAISYIYIYSRISSTMMILAISTQKFSARWCNYFFENIEVAR